MSITFTKVTEPGAAPRELTRTVVDGYEGAITDYAVLAEIQETLKATSNEVFWLLIVPNRRRMLLDALARQCAYLQQYIEQHNNEAEERERRR